MNLVARLTPSLNTNTHQDWAGQRSRASVSNLEISLSTWMQTSWMKGRDVTDGFSIHLTNRWSVSGYGGLGPGGHFTTPLNAARCKLPPCSASVYSKGDKPYLHTKVSKISQARTKQLWLQKLQFTLLIPPLGFPGMHGTMKGKKPSQKFIGRSQHQQTVVTNLHKSIQSAPKSPNICALI